MFADPPRPGERALYRARHLLFEAQLAAQQPVGSPLLTKDIVAGPQAALSAPDLPAGAIKVARRFPLPGKIAALVSILAMAYFVAAAVAAHLVMTQYNFFSDYISDYAVGPWGWIYGSAFLASAVGCFALVAALVLLLPPQALSRTGVVLLLLVGVSFAVDFAFPTDILSPGEPPTTVVGMVHLSDAMLGWVFFIVGSLLISARLKHYAPWKTWRPVLTTLAWVSAVLFLGLVGVVISKAPFGGLLERLFILDRNIWALVLGVLAFKALDSG